MPNDLDKPIILNDRPPTPEASRLRRLKKFIHAKWTDLSRRQKLLAGAGALILVGLIAFGVIQILDNKPKQIPRAHPLTKVQKAITVASPLTGLLTQPDLAKRPVTAIMIENSLDARPQSGLGSAGIVFEAIAEGGITRFISLFQEATPQYIGPVRSLRPYYIDWAAPFDASIAHVGGSPEALSQIRAGGKDLDQFFNADSYWREGSRIAPHNVYTSFDRLDSLNEAKGYTESKFTPWARKADHKLAVPTARTIDFAISGPDFNIHYDYDPASNTYARSEGGAAHRSTSTSDPASAQQLQPKVIIALIMPYAIIDGSGHSGYSTSGSETMYVFQDGAVTQGTWQKTDRVSQFVFKDMAGKILKINAGQTWVTALGNANQVSYAP